jgi:hypothetical protein
MKKWSSLGAAQNVLEQSASPSKLFKLFDYLEKGIFQSIQELEGFCFDRKNFSCRIIQKVD